MVSTSFTIPLISNISVIKSKLIFTYRKLMLKSCSILRADFHRCVIAHGSTLTKQYRQQYKQIGPSGMVYFCVDLQIGLVKQDSIREDWYVFVDVGAKWCLTGGQRVAGTWPSISSDWPCPAPGRHLSQTKIKHGCHIEGATGKISFVTNKSFKIEIKLF